MFQHTKLYLSFSKSQPRYSYKIYSYRKKKSVEHFTLPVSRSNQVYLDTSEFNCNGGGNPSMTIMPSRYSTMETWGGSGCMDHLSPCRLFLYFTFIKESM